MFDWIVARLKERSTWLGITGLLTAAGVGLSPDQMEAVIGAGLAVAGLIGVVFKDAPKP